MKISDVIYKLKQMMREHGDLEVETTRWDLERITYQGPKVEYRSILKGRERKPRFTNEWDSDDRKGEKVCRI